MANRDQFDPILNLKELPEELVRELKLTNQSDDKILNLFRKAGGTLDISECLVGYYKLYKEIKSRREMTVTLYRIFQKGLLIPTGKKGEYRIADTKVTEPDIFY